jgi:hypothetical protein
LSAAKTHRFRRAGFSNGWMPPNSDLSEFGPLVHTRELSARLMPISNACDPN